MPCYHPLRAFDGKAINPDTGKSVLLITSAQWPYATKEDFEKKGLDNLLAPFEEVHDYIEIPCGHCIGCRLDYSRRWAARSMAECYYHRQNWFLTLTYDDAHLPEDRKIHKEDFQKFIKDLRNDGRPLRYFGCGEYGDKFGRPHYHLIAFGLDLSDLVKYSQRKGYALYSSAYLNKIWNKGFVVVGEVNALSSAYVARYVLKKRDKEEAFFLMSRKPGIGNEWFMNNIKWNKTRYVLSDRQGGFITCSIPKYLKDKLGCDFVNGEALYERELSRMVVSDFVRLDDFRDFQDWLENHPQIKF